MIFRPFRKESIRIQGERSSSLDLARGRLVLISAFFMLTYMMVAARVVDLTVIQGALGVGRTVTQAAVVDDKPDTPRADIVDRNGVLLATTLKMSSLYADPALISDPVVTAQKLGKIFPDLSYGSLLHKLQTNGRFVWLRRNLTPAQQYQVLEIGEPGLGFERENTRVYPQGPLASHIIGYTDVDNKGLAGIERSFDNLLGKGEEPIKLSVDIRLQHVLHREVSRAMKEFTAQAGVGVIMDVNTGEMLAGVSLPDFDPADVGEADSDAIFNRMTLGVYELGSMFKIFSTAALLEKKDAPMSMTFDASKPLRVGRFKISDYHAENRVMTIPEIFMHSSNIGSALMGQAVGTQGLQDFYRDLGLLNTLNFEIHEVGAPIVPNPWRDVSTLTASYGHGIATSPLQMTAAVATIVNGGFFVKPKLVMSDKNDVAGNAPKEANLRVLSERTSHHMRELMRLVVTEGTGKSADVAGYSVGGKTGTAEKPGARGYDKKRLMSSFVGVFPMENPKYAILVVIDEPHGNKASYGYATGGWVGAPAVARIVASMTAILGIPAQPHESEISDSLSTYVKGMEVKGGQLVSYEAN